jgi:hypothetical protein
LRLEFLAKGSVESTHEFLALSQRKGHPEAAYLRKSDTTPHPGRCGLDARAQSCLRGLATGSRFTACTAKPPSALPSTRHVASVKLCSVESLVSCPWKVMRGVAAMLTVAGREIELPRPSQLHLTAGARLYLWQTPCLSSTPWGRTNPCRSRWHRRPNPQRRRVTAPRRSCRLNLARSSTLLAQRSETSRIP